MALDTTWLRAVIEAEFADLVPAGLAAKLAAIAAAAVSIVSEAETERRHVIEASVDAAATMVAGTLSKVAREVEVVAGDNAELRRRITDARTRLETAIAGGYEKNHPFGACACALCDALAILKGGAK